MTTQSVIYGQKYKRMGVELERVCFKSEECGEEEGEVLGYIMRNDSIESGR